LNSIDFVWDRVAQKAAISQTNWMGMFKKLVAYKVQHKHTNVRQRENCKEDTKLGKWVTQQRVAYKKDKLIPNRIELLDSIDFVWEGVTHRAATYQTLWMNMFKKLVLYKHQHQNTMVPRNYKEDPSLGQWVRKQRHSYKYKKDKLSSNRIDLLNSIDFVWERVRSREATNQRKWMDMYQKLIAYKHQHQNTMVPRNYKEDPSLGQWVRKQRHSYKYNKRHANSESN
jgi:hypothetical protein